MSWTQANPKTQGYRLGGDEVALLVLIGVIPGWTPRHPFDRIWNHGLRHLAGAPELLPNPARRRHAFKLATVWLAAVAALFASGAATAALVLGGVLVAVCALVTATNFLHPLDAARTARRATGVQPHHVYLATEVMHA